MRECKVIYKNIQEDTWDQGCIGSSDDVMIEYPIHGNTKDELISRICSFIGCDKEAIEIDPCGDDPSRIDAQVTEDENGYLLTKAQWEQFKRGEIKAYLCTYSFYFDDVIRTPAKLS